MYVFLMGIGIAVSALVWTLCAYQMTGYLLLKTNGPTLSDLREVAKHRWWTLPLLFLFWWLALAMAGLTSIYFHLDTARLRRRYGP